MLAPVALPRLRLLLGGNDVSAGVIAARVRLVLSQPAALDLTLEASDIVPVPGIEASLTLGMPPHVLFAGTITSVTREFAAGLAPRLRLRGYDALHRLRLRQTAEAYKDTTLAEIAEALAARHGLAPRADAPGPRWPVILQARQTDLILLQDLAASVGYAFRLEGETLHLFPPQGAGTRAEVTMAEVISLSVETNDVQPDGSVSVESWDPALADSGIEYDGEGAIVQAVRGLAAAEGGAAAAAAQAQTARRRARRLVIDAELAGRADLRPGDLVAIAGAGVPPDATPVLTEVVHEIDATRGFVTVLSTRLPDTSTDRANAPRGAEATLGIVASVADPRRLGRVQVRLPAHGDLVGHWAQVVLPGAGPTKGLAALPAPGDRVLVLLIAGDPAQAVVLGGLYGPAAPDDAGVSGDSVRRFLLRTGAGQGLVLEDDGRCVTLTQADGARVDLAPDALTLAAANGSRLHLARDGAELLAVTDLRIAAPGRALRIVAASVDFEQG